MRKIALMVAAAVLLSGAFFLYLRLAADADRPTWRLARVERGSLVSTVSASGTVNAVVTVQVGSQVSGQISKLLADFNRSAEHTSELQSLMRISYAVCCMKTK